MSAGKKKYLGMDEKINISTPLIADKTAISYMDGICTDSKYVDDVLNKIGTQRTLDAEEIILNIDLDRIKNIIVKLSDKQLEFLSDHLSDVKTYIEREKFKRL